MPTVVAHGDMVGFWQSFLLAYNQFPCTGLDGHYGSQTTAGTKNIQSFFGLPRDGIAGKNTLDAASHWLHSAGSDGFLTTYYAPNYSSGDWWPNYRWVYGGAGRCQASARPSRSCSPPTTRRSPSGTRADKATRPRVRCKHLSTGRSRDGERAGATPLCTQHLPGCQGRSTASVRTALANRSSEHEDGLIGPAAQEHVAAGNRAPRPA